MFTADQPLLYAFAYYDLGNDPDEYPFAMRLVNWERARTIPSQKRWLSKWEEEIDLLFEVGLSIERVLPLVDPAIRPIVQRLLELHCLTTSSCSGHPGERGSYLTVAFPSAEMGGQFVTACNEAFQSLQLTIEGDRVSVFSENFLARLPVEVSIQARLGITFSSWTRTTQARQKFWQTFSAVIDRFDHQGIYHPPMRLFREKGAPSNKYGLYDEVLETLFSSGYKTAPWSSR